MEFAETVVYIDRCLTDRIAEALRQVLKRLIPPLISASTVTDADRVLLFHAHADHADPETPRLVALASPAARFICPASAIKI